MFHGPTELVPLDWLSDRLNLDPKIQIRYIDTKHQLADILTKGIFTRDEWNNLLLLVNISIFSSTSGTKNFSLISCSSMAKRIQKSKGWRKSCVQVATSSDEYIFLFYCDKFLRRIESDCIWKSGEKPDSRMSVEPSSSDAASTSQVRLKDAYLGGLMEGQRGDPSRQEDEESEHSDNPEAGTWYYKEETVAQNNEAWGETPCTRSQFFSRPGKSKGYRSGMRPLFPHFAGHFSSSGSSRKRLWHEFKNL